MARSNITNSSTTFEITISVEPADIDQLGHVNNVTYLRWVQEIATAHWTATAPEVDQEKLLWVVLRHEIDYQRAAFLGEQIVARTWVGHATKLKFERHTEFMRTSDTTLVAKARTIWCPIDVLTRRPVAVSPAVRAIFSVQ